MSHKKSSAVNGKSLTTGLTHEEQLLAQLLEQPTWNQEQAEKILQAQGSSGKGIAAFAMQWGQKAGRLYNWKTRLKKKSRRADPADAGGDEAEKSRSSSEGGRPQATPGPWNAQEYVERATSGPDRMWRLLGMRPSGPVLLCAVHWVNRSGCPKPYSLVQLELNEPALRWNDFATADAASQALEQRRVALVARGGKVADPELVKVAVRAPTAQPEREHAPQAAVYAECGSISVCMPSGERIQIPPGVPEALIGTVLRMVRALSC